MTIRKPARAKEPKQIKPKVVRESKRDKDVRERLEKSRSASNNAASSVAAPKTPLCAAASACVSATSAMSLGLSGQQPWKQPMAAGMRCRAVSFAALRHLAYFCFFLIPSPFCYVFSLCSGVCAGKCCGRCGVISGPEGYLGGADLTRRRRRRSNGSCSKHQPGCGKLQPQGSRDGR